MHRRALLSTAGVSLSALVAGCLGDDTQADGDPDGDDDATSSDEPRYEECPREIVPYDDLTSELQTEVDEALDGPYEATRVHLRDAMDTERSYLSVDGDYYDPSVATSGDHERLTLEQVVPKALPSPRSVYVAALDAEQVHLEVVSERGTVLLDEHRDLSEERGTVEFGELDRVGSHPVSLVVDEQQLLGGDETITITESRFDVELTVEDGEAHVGGSIADLVPCQFDD